MTLWVCGGDGGCGTKYAVGLFKCPRCHNTDFYEDGDPMAKITRHGGASDKTLPVEEPEVEAVAEATPASGEYRGEPGPELVDLPDSAAVHPAGPEEEGGEESSPGSSSSASTEPQPTNSEPSSKPRRKPARTTASRSSKDQTENSSASSTDGGPETGTSAAEGSTE